jgi:hypothetical protein
MKKITVDSSGVIVRKPTEFPKPKVIANIQTRAGQIVVQEAESISKEFITELKDQLVKELASELGKLVLNMGTTTIHNIIHRDIGEDEPRRNADGTLFEPIKIDDSVVVSQENVRDFEKKYGEIASTQVATDKDVKFSINKLKNLKKGE